MVMASQSKTAPKQGVLGFDSPVSRRRPRRATDDIEQTYATARQWLLGRLQDGPVSCYSLKQDPDWPASGNPAARVLELRRDGHDIRTLRLGEGPRTFHYALFTNGSMVGGGRG